jgi:hypothetical protein
MWIAMTKQHRKEKSQYNFKESCEDCRYFCLKTERCSMMYPTLAHRRAVYIKASDGERIYFCKMFEAE